MSAKTPQELSWFERRKARKLFNRLSIGQRRQMAERHSGSDHYRSDCYMDPCSFYWLMMATHDPCVHEGHSSPVSSPVESGTPIPAAESYSSPDHSAGNSYDSGGYDSGSDSGSSCDSSSSSDGGGGGGCD